MTVFTAGGLRRPSHVAAVASAASTVHPACGGRQARDRRARKIPGQPWSVLLDEFSAISGGRTLAADLLERGRSKGVAVIPTAQSWAGLGSEREADRLAGAASVGAVGGWLARPALYPDGRRLRDGPARGAP
jgi:hypothetical protein